MIAAIAVFQEQPGTVNYKGFQRNALFLGQLLQLPSQFRRDPQFNVHALNRIGVGRPPPTGRAFITSPTAHVFQGLRVHSGKRAAEDG